MTFWALKCFGGSSQLGGKLPMLYSLSPDNFELSRPFSGTQICEAPSNFHEQPPEHPNALNLTGLDLGPKCCIRIRLLLLLRPVRQLS